MAGGVGKTACVVHGLPSVIIGEGEAVLLINEHRIVGVLNLSGAGTQDEFTVTGDCEDAAALVDVLSILTFADDGVASDEVSEGTHARFHGQSADRKVNEGGEYGEGLDAGAQCLVLSKNDVEVTAFTLVCCFATFFPEGVVQVDEAFLDGFIVDYFRSLESIDLLHGKL